jgi:hypothetical protein
MRIRVERKMLDEDIGFFSRAGVRGGLLGGGTETDIDPGKLLLAILAMWDSWGRSPGLELIRTWQTEGDSRLAANEKPKHPGRL